MCQPRHALPHVDHPGPDLDPAGFRADGGEQRERGSVLLGRVVDAEVGVVARFGTTRALDGQQTADWDGFTASWGYHPDTGLDVVVEPQPQD